MPLCTAYPDEPNYAYELAMYRHNLALLLGENLNRLDDTELVSDQARTALEELIRQHPDTPAYRHILGRTRATLAQVAFQRQQWPQARQHLAAAIAEQRAALKPYPKHPQYLAMLADHQRLLAEVLIQMKDHAAAARLAEELAGGSKNGESHLLSARLLARCIPLVEHDQQLDASKRELRVGAKLFCQVLIPTASARFIRVPVLAAAEPMFVVAKVSAGAAPKRTVTPGRCAYRVAYPATCASRYLKPRTGIAAMTFTSGLKRCRNWFGIAGRPATQLTGFRPRLELLEDRLTPATYHVTDLGGGSSGAGTTGTLRYLVDNVAQDGDTIVFDLSGTINLNGAVSIAKDITIDGSGQTVTIDGNGLRCFNINTGSSSTEASILNLTIVDGNAPSSQGAGIRINSGNTLTLSNVTMTNCSTNRGGGNGDGGAIAVLSGSTLIATNCTLTGNTATNGAGIYVLGTAHLINNTITGNSGAGILIAQGGTNGSVFMTNTIVAGNSGTDVFKSAGASFSSGGGNLYGTSLQASWVTTGSYPDIQTASPGLDTLQNNGGLTSTIALLDGSPALGKGNPNDPSFGTLPDTDQRGFARFTGNTIDIGAFQQHFTYIAPGSVGTATAGQLVAFNLGSFAYAGDAANFWQATVDWGDGTTDTVFTTFSEGSLGTQNHNYATAGSFTATVTVTATDGDFIQRTTGSVTVGTAVSLSGPASLPEGVVGAVYAGATFTASGGSGGYVFSTTGDLAGLSLEANTGALSGTPTAAGTFSFTVTATDSNGASDSESYFLVIEPAVTITTTSLPDATVGSFYLQLLAASGGSGSYTFDVTDGALPDGLSLSSTGVLFGTPTSAAGSPFDFTVTVTDTVTSQVATQDYSLVVQPGAPVPVTTPSAQLQADPLFPGKLMLVVTGTEGDDIITIKRFASSTTSFLVTVNNTGPTLLFTNVTGRLQVFGLDGNDTITLKAAISKQTVLDGGAGNDVITGARGADYVTGGDGDDALNGGAGKDWLVETGDVDMLLIQGTTKVNGSLTGGLGTDVLYRKTIEQAHLTGGPSANTLDASLFSGKVRLLGLGGDDSLTGGTKNDVLVGGDDDDSLSGSSGRDLLIGGLGVDALDGSAGGDILIGGSSNHETSVAALNAVMLEWASAASYAARIAHLLGTTSGSKSGFVRLNSTTVFDDGLANTLTGGINRDWFFQGVADLVTDPNLGGTETVTNVP